MRSPGAPNGHEAADGRPATARESRASRFRGPVDRLTLARPAMGHNARLDFTFARLAGAKKQTTWPWHGFRLTP